jgi:3-hydroxyacyl-[acyl-carrier-protein] dehydratase
MKPYEHLPHRYPFIMLDTAEIIEENRRAQGSRQITINDPIVLPDGTLPQIYIIESMAQISGIASGRKGRSLFAGITSLTFHGTVRAGDTLEVESMVERNIGGLFMFTARAHAAGELIAAGGIVLHFDENVA